MRAQAEQKPQQASKQHELAEMAEAFERTEFSDDELEATRKTRRSTPR